MTQEHQLQLRIPCWVVADAAGDDLAETSNIVMVQSGDKAILQLFLDKPEAERFIQQAGLTGKTALTIPSIQHLARLTEHLQGQGANEVNVFFQAGEGVTKARVPMADFNEGLKKVLAGG